MTSPTLTYLQAAIFPIHNDYYSLQQLNCIQTQPGYNS